MQLYHVVYVGGVHSHETGVYSGMYESMSDICGVISPRVVPTRVIVSISISCVEFLLGFDVVTDMMLLFSSGCHLKHCIVRALLLVFCVPFPGQLGGVYLA